MCRATRVVLITILLQTTFKLILSDDVAVVFSFEDNDTLVYCGNQTDLPCSEFLIPQLPSGIKEPVGIYDETFGLLGIIKAN